VSCQQGQRGGQQVWLQGGLGRVEGGCTLLGPSLAPAPVAAPSFLSGVQIILCVLAHLFHGI
jgi:hypothetical protein